MRALPQDAEPSVSYASPVGTVDTIIIGAGVAGLGAAQALQAVNKKVIVLEARSRIGGRLYTRHDVASVPVELGGEFVHGKHAKTWELIKANGIETAEMRHALPGKPTAVVPSVRDQLWQNLAEPHPHESLATYLDRNGIQGEKIPSELQYLHIDEEPLYRLNAAFTRQWMHRWLGGGELYGEHDFRVPAGYDQVPRLLSQGVAITLHAIVTQIAYGDSVRVTYRQGGVEQQITGKTVIITLPLGVLKQGDILFKPALPLAKQKSILALGIIDVAKLIYIFPEKVLPEGVDVLEDRGNNPPYWMNGTRGSAAAPHDIAVGWTSGDNARQLLAMEPDEALNFGLRSLRTLLKKPHITPFKMMSHYWGADPFTRGALSFVPYGVSANTYDRLAEPTGRTLFWAGEATYARDPATVHGAYESGLRAAQEVIAVLG